MLVIKFRYNIRSQFVYATPPPLYQMRFFNLETRRRKFSGTGMRYRVIVSFLLQPQDGSGTNRTWLSSRKRCIDCQRVLPMSRGIFSLCQGRVKWESKSSLLLSLETNGFSALRSASDARASYKKFHQQPGIRTTVVWWGGAAFGQSKWVNVLKNCGVHQSPRKKMNWHNSDYKTL